MAAVLGHIPAVTRFAKNSASAPATLICGYYCKKPFAQAG